MFSLFGLLHHTTTAHMGLFALLLFEALFDVLHIFLMFEISNWKILRRLIYRGNTEFESACSIFACILL